MASSTKTLALLALLSSLVAAPALAQAAFTLPTAEFARIAARGGVEPPRLLAPPPAPGQLPHQQFSYGAPCRAFVAGAKGRRWRWRDTNAHAILT